MSPLTRKALDGRRARCQPERMTDRKINPDPLFAGPAGGTATRLCKRPELARERLELSDLRASASGSRLSGEEWTYRVSARVEVRGESMALELPGRVALGFGLDLLAGAAYCYAPGLVVDGEVRPASPLPAAEELRLLGLAAEASLHRSPEAAAELAYLRDLVARTEPGAWAQAERHEHELDGLRRAGLVKVQGFGAMTRACATDAGRALAAMVGGAP